MQGYAYQQPYHDPTAAYGAPDYAQAGFYAPATPFWNQPPDATESGLHPAFDPVANPAGESRLRWGRLFLLILGVGMLAFAVANLTSSPAPRSAAKPGAKGTDPTLSRSIDDVPVGDGSTPGSNSVPDDVTPIAEAPKTAAPAVSGGGMSAGSHPARAARRHHRPARATTGRRAAHAGMPQHAQGARGAGAAGDSLPYTGASTWIAAVAGTLLLLLGMLVQYRALEIGEAASMYRRGPLLRPVYLIGLMVRNTPRASSWVVARTPALQQLMERWKVALDSRAHPATFVNATRR